MSVESVSAAADAAELAGERRVASRVAGVAALVLVACSLAYIGLKLGYHGPAGARGMAIVDWARLHPNGWRVAPAVNLIGDAAMLVLVAVGYELLRPRAPVLALGSLISGVVGLVVLFLEDAIDLFAFTYLAEQTEPGAPESKAALLTLLALRTTLPRVILFAVAGMAAGFSAVVLWRGGAPRAWGVIGLLLALANVLCAVGLTFLILPQSVLMLVWVLWLAVMLLRGQFGSASTACP